MENQIPTIREEDRRFAFACCLELGLGLFALVMGGAFGVEVRSNIPALSDGERCATGLLIGSAAGILMAIVMQGISKIPLRSIQALNEVASVQLWSLLKGLSTAQLIVLALTAGVGEELLFRGWLMQSITGSVSTCSMESLVAGIIGSSILFGFAHPISRMYVFLAFLMGCFFGILYWCTNNLLVPIAAHWIYDAILMVAFVRSQGAGRIMR